MAEVNQFLETEAALKVLLDELNNLKSASEQIGEAGDIARRVTNSAQQVVNLATDVLHNSNRMLAHLEEAALADNLDKIQKTLHEEQVNAQARYNRNIFFLNEQKDLLENLNQHAQSHTVQIEAVQTKVLEIADQNHERHQELGEKIKSIQTQASEIAQQNQKRQEELEGKLNQIRNDCSTNRTLGFASVIELIIVIGLLSRLIMLR